MNRKTHTHNLSFLISLSKSISARKLLGSTTFLTAMVVSVFLEADFTVICHAWCHRADVTHWTLSFLYRPQPPNFSRIRREKKRWPKIRRKKMRLAENLPKKYASRPNIRKKLNSAGVYFFIHTTLVMCYLSNINTCDFCHVQSVTFCMWPITCVYLYCSSVVTMHNICNSRRSNNIIGNLHQCCPSQIMSH